MNDLHAQVYPYAVDALPTGEAEEFEAHLVDCSGCRAEVAELRDVTAALSRSVATEPPPELRSAVLAAAARTPQPPVAAPRFTPRGSAHSVSPGIPSSQRREPAAEPSLATVVPLQSSQRRRLPALLAAATVLAALALGGWALQSQQAAQQAAEEAMADTERLTELLSASDVNVLSGQITTGATGTVVMSPSRKQAVFVATELPELPAGKVYQAWTIAGESVPAGTFSARDAKTAVTLPPAAFDAQSVAITVEPAGGSQAPSTDAIFTVSVPPQR